ncbi:DUF1080 domain-containing protein [Bacteroidota bacterium]
MKNRNISRLTLLALVLTILGCSSPGKNKEAAKNPQDSQSETEWTMLFNGHDFEGWRSVRSDGPPEHGWKIENEELIIMGPEDKAEIKAGDIVTLKKYSDFELEWEWKMLTKGGNSGVKYYVNFYGEDEYSGALGLEYQILDDDNHPWMLDGKMHPGDSLVLGACYELYEPHNREVAPLGEWNSSKIVSSKGNVEHWLNGIKIVEFNRFSDDFNYRVEHSKFRDLENFGQQDSGVILFQDHPGITHYRNIRIREL